ncbi:MAG: hypothetical protein B7Z37_23785 [Verrucomicrobia bacterium 12-59-8]|nr:MAG: hypothetical protein B7Z37_23785 [Verrucomicrobia bacterium 12-59-8]
MTEFLERKVGTWEADFGGTALLGGMLLLGAFGTAEVYRLVTGSEYCKKVPIDSPWPSVFWAQACSG